MGARRLHLNDWPFGAGSRRRVLDALLRDEQPEDGWTVSALEARVEVTNGGLDGLLPGLIDLSLAERRDHHVHRSSGAPQLAKALVRLLEISDGLPDRAPTPLSRRPYRQSGRA
jgi:hypothetical protein